MEHRIEVRSRTIAHDGSAISAGSRGADFLAIATDAEWDGMAVRCTMRNGAASAEVETSVSGCAARVEVPGALTAAPGALEVALFGYGEGQRRLATAVMDEPIEIRG